MELSPDEIADILAAIDKLDCATVEVTVGNVRIAVRRKGAPEAAAFTQGAAAVSQVAAPAVVAHAAPPRVEAAGSGAATKTRDAGGPAAAAAAADEPAAWLEREAQGKVRVVRAPMIGTFYRAKAPGEPPFVEVGAKVQAGDTLGLVEVMKLFQSLVAETGGTVGAVFVRNGEMVEYEQPVLAICLE